MRIPSCCLSCRRNSGSGLARRDGSRAPTISALPARAAITAPNTGETKLGAEHAQHGRRLWLFAYCLEGIGYVVSATFIVAIVHTAQGGFESGAWVWIIVGLAGIPACVLWTRHADYRKALSRLATAYWIQAAGIVAVAVAPNSVGAALASAVTLGATLVGVVMLTIGLAPGIDLENPRRIRGAAHDRFQSRPDDRTGTGRLRGGLFRRFSCFAAEFSPAGCNECAGYACDERASRPEGVNAGWSGT